MSNITPNDVEVEITALDQYKVAEYKFNNTLYDLIPEFNTEFTDYTYEDIVDGEVTTRTIYSDSLPTIIKFGNTEETNRSISLLEVLKLDVSEITDMFCMFARCSSLTRINGLMNWNISKVISMKGMFDHCTSLTTMEDISNWDVSNVTNMYGMFCGIGTTILNIENWNVSNVTDMKWMFSGCNFDYIDLSNWNVNNVTRTSEMFSYSTTLTSLNLSNWNLNKLENSDNMLNSPNLNNIIINNSDYNSVNKIISQLPTRTSDSMGTLDIAGIDDISQVDITTASSKYWSIIQYKIAEYKFNNTLYDLIPEFNDEFTDYTYEDAVDGEVTTRTIYSDSLPTSITFGDYSGNYDKTNSLLEVNYLNTSNVTDMAGMFAYCNNLTTLDANNWDTSNVTDMTDMFYGCESLTELNVSGWDTSKVTDIQWMFGYYDNGDETMELTSITGLENWDTSNVTNMEGMFCHCRNLTTINLSNFNTSNVTNMKNMFEGCESLTSIGDLSEWDTSNVEHMPDVFNGCHSLESVGNLSNWDTSKVTNMGMMFYDCKSLTSIGNLSNWKVGNVEYMDYMFYNCNQLTTLDVSNWDTSNVTDMSSIFDGCTNLTLILMNNSDYISVNKVITELPTRTSDSYGTLDIAGIDDISQVDITTAESKFWNIESGVEQIKIAEYKFNNTLYDLIPEFNEGFTYNYEDIVNGEITTRTIHNNDQKINIKNNIEFINDKYNSHYRPMILENEDIQFSCSDWDICTIDLREYAGKSVTVSFTLTTHDNSWCEFGLSAKLGDYIGETVEYEQIIAKWYNEGDASETINYTKTFNIVENTLLIIEGMEGVLSDISVLVEGTNLFPDKIIDNYYITDKGYYMNTPRYIDNKLYYSNSWNNLFINVSDYIGKDINISFDIIGQKNDVGWTEFEYGQFNAPRYYTILKDRIIYKELNDTEEVHINSTFTLYKDYIYIGGMGGRVSNLQINVLNNNKLKINKTQLENVGYYQEPFNNYNNYLCFSSSGWDIYSIDVKDYKGKEATVSFQVETFEDAGTNSWLEAYSTGYNDAIIYENYSEYRLINVNYTTTLDEVFHLQGCCIKMKNIQILVDGINLYETLPGFNGYYMFDSFKKTSYYKIPSKVNNELYFVKSPWNVIGYDLSDYIGKTINVSFDVDIIADEGYNELWISIQNEAYYSDNIDTQPSTLIKEVEEEIFDYGSYEENITINYNKSITVSENNRYMILSGVNVEIKNLAIKSNIIDKLPTKISFNGATSLTEILHLDFSNIVDASNMFYGCTKLTNIVGIKDWDVKKVTTMYMMFTSCTSLTELDLSNWEPSSLTTMYGMFYKCSNLTTIKLGKGNTPVLESTEGMFNSCTELLSIDFGGLNVSNVNNMGGMFSDCRKLKSLDISHWDVSKVTNFGAMFRRCYSLLELNLRNWDLSSANNISTTFEACTSLVTLDLSDFVVEDVSTLSGLFQLCSNLITLNLNGWHLKKDVAITKLFDNCDKLMYVNMERSDAFTVNKFIEALPIKSENNKGHINIKHVDDFVDVNIEEAISKYWIVIRNQGNITNVHIGDNNIITKLLQNKKIKNIYLGNTKML